MQSIEFRQIDKYFGDQRVLDQVSFTVGAGSVTGLLGPNGAGKTTLMKILTAYIPPDGGTAFVQGADVQKDASKIRKQVGYLPENNPLYPEMYVREYLGFVLKMYHFTGSVKKRLDEVVELTGLLPEQHKKIGALSKGFRQRVGLAQALIHDPPVLILDEPTTGLDPNQLAGIRSVIAALGKEKTILLSTHIMQEVEAVCDRVVILNKGKIVADGAVGALLPKASAARSYRLEIKEKVSEELFSPLEGLSFAENLSGNVWELHFETNRDVRENIFRFVVTRNLTLLSFSVSRENLEDVFRSLTREEAVG